MRRMTLFLVVLALVALSACYVVKGAMTNSAGDIVSPAKMSYIGSGNTTLDPLYLFCNEVEGYIEGTSVFPSLSIIESTGATYWTKFQGGNQSANLTYTLPTAYGTTGYVLSATDAGVMSWVANAGTWAGGAVSSDATLANGVDLLSSTTTAHTNAIQARDIDGGAYVDVLRWTNGDTAAMVLGAATVEFSLASTGLDISTAGVITNAAGITNTGVLTSAGGATNLNTSGADAVNVGTGTYSGTVTIGNNSASVAFATSQWDITGAGAMSGFSSLGLSGDITMATGKGILSSTTTAETVGLYGYDNNGSARVGGIVITNGDTPATVVGNANGTTAITSSDWAIGTTGIMTGIGAITTDGLVTGTAGATVTGAAVNLNASSNFAVNLGTGTNNAASAIGGGAGTWLVDTSDWDITTAGVATNIDSVAGNNGNTLNLSINQRFEFTDNSETFGIDVGTTSNTAELCTDSGITSVDFNDVDRLEDVEYVQGDSGTKIVLTANEQVLFIDGAESFGFDLDGSNIIKLATDTGATTLDMNDVDQLIGVEKITFDDGGFFWQSLNNNFELTENSDTLQLIFGSNKIELGQGGDGVAELDLNDVDTLTDVETITGDGTGYLGGFLKTVTDDSDAHAVLVTESGTVLTNAGSGGAAAHTLPAAAAGLEYTFVVMAAQELRVTPAAGDVINIAGVAAEAAEYWTANAVGEVLHLIAVDGTNWVAISSTGTWTQQTPP